ncbi:Thioredoxin-like fold protein [Actinidia chinensis var. chinensis]|uniref:Thioredoxin-like fold protein n=1 Tax=Actinidia chinensis var. chinensis TaxID=1590841 RepID=A0A2R6P9H0_ACTCC|nr:Thioredoxin-like fold protein [Actinidia chinensis var. chinensis]
MGCASSKQPVCRNCKALEQRSYSMHVHHRPESDDDTYHIVALTSSTLGSLKLDSLDRNLPMKDGELRNGGDENFEDERKKDFSLGVIEAKTWSRMMEEKIPKIVPKTPIRTPPGEPETINAWELMEGLEDTSPLRSPHHLRSFSFHVSLNSIPSSNEFPKRKSHENGAASPKPLWLEMADKESNSNLNLNSNSMSVVSEFDPDVISQFRKALEDLPSENPFHLKPLEDEKQNVLALEETEAKKVNCDITCYKCKDRVLLYFTSLRGVRKTYEDCCHTRVILKGTGVRVDERDVSMHSGFKEELKELLGDRFNGSGLPRVFVGKKYIGGAEEIRKLHEEGQLEGLLEGCEVANNGSGSGSGGGGEVCEACGDIRFVPCETCSGSCKIYYEKECDEECDKSDYGFQRCPDCNENGIIRCPICCDQ